jgi:hypothetical protein
MNIPEAYVNTNGVNRFYLNEAPTEFMLSADSDEILLFRLRYLLSLRNGTKFEYTIDEKDSLGIRNITAWKNTMRRSYSLNIKADGRMSVMKRANKAYK